MRAQRHNNSLQSTMLMSPESILMACDDTPKARLAGASSRARRASHAPRRLHRRLGEVPHVVRRAHHDRHGKRRAKVGSPRPRCHHAWTQTRDRQEQCQRA